MKERLNLDSWQVESLKYISNTGQVCVPLPPSFYPLPDHSLTVQEIPVFSSVSALGAEAGDKQLIKFSGVFTQLLATLRPHNNLGQQREFRILKSCQILR